MPSPSIPNQSSMTRLKILNAAAAIALLASHAWAQGAPPPPPPPPPPAGMDVDVPSEAGTGTISGVVIEGATKAPLPGAVVYLGPPGHGPPNTPVRQMTDAKGRFVFRGLPAYGDYFISVAKFGYFDGSFGRGNGAALGARIKLASGEWFSGVTVTMWRPAAIGGRVVDQLGEPVVGVAVRVLPLVVIAGRRQLTAGPFATTDDRGMYRIPDLMPGRYFVEVPSVQSSVPVSALTAIAAVPANSLRPESARETVIHASGNNSLRVGRYVTPLPTENGRAMAYPPTFHPSATTVAAAQAVDVNYGDDRSGIDVRLQPVPAFAVSGRVEGPAQAWTNLTLKLKLQGLEELGSGSEAADALVAADGSFTFLNVPAGTYTLDARRTITQFTSSFTLEQIATLPFPASIAGYSGYTLVPGVFSAPFGVRMSVQAPDDGDPFWGRQTIDVNGRDIRDVVVTLRKTSRMSGRLVWDEPLTPSELRAAEVSSVPLVVRLEPAGGVASLGLPRASVSRTATEFSIDDLLPGEYLLSVMYTGRLKSVQWDGRDYTDRAFDASAGQDITDVVVTVTKKSVLLTGVVRDERGGTAVDDAAVIVFPADQALWRNVGIAPARIKSVAVSSARDYRFQTLPAGEYYVVAVAGDLISAWQDPAFLEVASRVASRVTLDWGDQKSVELRIVRVSR